MNLRIRRVEAGCTVVAKIRVKGGGGGGRVGTYDDEDTQAGSREDTGEIVVVGDDLLAEWVRELGFDGVGLKDVKSFSLHLNSGKGHTLKHWTMKMDR